MDVPFEVVDDTCNDRVVIFYRDFKPVLLANGIIVPTVKTERLELTNAEAMELGEQLFRILRKPRTDYQRKEG